MDTSPPTRAPRRRSRTPAERADDQSVPGPRARERRRPDGRSANDAVWWVVLYQGALDYTQSLGDAGQDAAAAARLVDSYQAVIRP